MVYPRQQELKILGGKFIFLLILIWFFYKFIKNLLVVHKF